MNIMLKIMFMMVSLFGLGVLYFVFLPTFNVYLIPSLISTANQSAMSAADKVTVIAGINRTYNVVMLIPFILCGIAILWAFISSILSSEGESTY